ncbi:MAG: MAPEG family protein [Pseudomonadota bacterium]
MSTALFWPAFIMAMATYGLYVATFLARKKLVTAGKAKISHYRTYENEIPESRLWHNAIANQFELPVLFYAACAFAMVLGFDDGLTLFFAWGFVLAKCAHIATHTIGNRLRFRAPAFGLAMLMLLALWLRVALGAL